jgi:RimJ/RimL family protein N-acetyltransferase
MFFNNKLVGYSFLRLFGYKIPSYGVIIKNHYRARGFGTILSKWTIDKAREFGYNKVILKTYKENISAKKIYEKLGFKIVGETEDKKQFKMEIIL